MSDIGNDKKVVIRFDSKDDDKVREQARKEYEIAKNFKLSKLPLYKFYPASDPSSRNQFNLSQKTDLTVLEVNLTNDEDKNFDIINQVKDFISLQDNLEYKDEKMHTYSPTKKVQRFLVYCK